MDEDQVIEWAVREFDPYFHIRREVTTQQQYNCGPMARGRVDLALWPRRTLVDLGFNQGLVVIEAKRHITDIHDWTAALAQLISYSHTLIQVRDKPLAPDLLLLMTTGKYPDDYGASMVKLAGRFRVGHIYRAGTNRWEWRGSDSHRILYHYRGEIRANNRKSWGLPVLPKVGNRS